MALTLISGSADVKLCETWTSNLKTAQNARIQFERQWLQNLSFYMGRQWIVTSRSPDGNGFVLSEAPVGDKYRVRHTANRIRRIARQALTKLSKEEPQFYTKPESTDESDRAAASAADAIAEYLIYSKHFNIKRTEATFWAILFGSSFLKNWFDPNSLELDGKPGKIDFDAIPAPYLFVPHLQISDLQRQPWCIHGRTMSQEEVWNQFQKEVEPQTNVAQTLLDSRFLTSLGIIHSAHKNAKMCYVKECWVKPSRNFPNGAMFALSENQVLYCYEPPQDPTLGFPEEQQQLPIDFQEGDADSENEGPLQKPEVIPPRSTLPGLSNYEYAFPYRHGEFPFNKIDHSPTGAFYADSDIKDLIPLQKEYNRTRSVMLEHRNLTAKPQYSYIKGSFDPNHYTSKPGLLLAINLGFEPPVPLEQPDLSASISTDVEMTLRDMDFAGNTNEIAQGRTPPGIEAASAIAYLQEENDTILFTTVQSLETCVQDTGRQVLSLVHDYWDEDRIVTITSKNQAWEVRKFKASSLKPMSDFRVVSGSMAPRSDAAKQATITELMKMGYITPEQGMRYLPFNEVRSLYNEIMIDVNHANRENMKMAEGIPINIRTSGQTMPHPENPAMQVPMPMMAEEVDENGMPILGEDGQPIQYIITINSFDNHEKHVEVHQRYMKSQEFELLPQNIQKIFMDHVDEHKKELVKEMRYAQQGITMSPNGQSSQPPSPNGNQPIEEGVIRG